MKLNDCLSRIHAAAKIEDDNARWDEIDAAVAAYAKTRREGYTQAVRELLEKDSALVFAHHCLWLREDLAAYEASKR